MSYLLTINGVTVTSAFHTDSLDIKEYRTKKLDTCELTIINSTLAEAYDVDSEVIIIEDGQTTYWLLALDDFSRVAKESSDGISFTYEYEHRLSLVEYNLEGTTLPNITYRQPVNGVVGDGDTYSVWDQLTRLREIAELKLSSDTTRLWDYDASVISHLGENMQTYASKIKGKQITLNRPNARQALDKILQQIGASSKMIDQNTVSWEFYNVKGEEVDLSSASVYKGNQNLEQYADRLDMFLENAITEENLNKQAIVYPSVAWASVRGSEAFLTSDNFIMEVPYPIDTVLKFEVYVNCRVTVITDTVVTFEADITELLSEQSAYNALLYNLNQSVGGFPDTVARNNSVYYEQGKSRIEGFHENLEVFSPFGSYFSYRHLLCYAYWKATGIYATDAEFDNGTNFYDFMFRLTYVPRINERLRLEKQNPIGTRTLFYNQDERLPDIEKQGSRVRDDLERLGNKQLTATIYDVDYNDRPRTGAYYGDYIVDTSRWVKSKSAGLSEITFSKFSPLIDRDVSINTENRDTAIDTNNAVIRHELYNEYIEATFNGIHTNDSLLTEDGIERFIQFVNVGTPTKVNPVELAAFLHNGSSTVKIIGCKSVGTDNVLKFDFGFDSVNIVGRKSTLQDGAWISEYVEYVEDDLGRLEDFNFVLFGEYAISPDTFANRATAARTLPELAGTITTTSDEYIDGFIIDRFMLYKDGGEIFKFTYQLSMFNASGEDEIIIGEKLATNNPLVIKENETLYLYKWSEDFQKNQLILDYDEKLEIINTGTPTASQIVVTFGSDSEKARVTVESTSSFKWAIGNDDGELYLAVNHINNKTVYFKPKKER